MDRVAHFYGFETDRHGFMRCPFHQGDRTASLKAYSDGGGWHCFGCNRGGSVIDFVMELYDLTFQQAILRLNSDFCLGLSGDRPSPLEMSKIIAHRRKEARESKMAEDAYNEMSIRYRDLWEAKKAGYEHPLYAEACKKLDYLDYWFETHQLGR